MKAIKKWMPGCAAWGKTGSISSDRVKNLTAFSFQVAKFLAFGQQYGAAVLSMRFGCMYDHGDGLKFCDSLQQAPKDANVVVGAVLRVPPVNPEADLSPGQAVSRFL